MPALPLLATGCLGVSQPLVDIKLDVFIFSCCAHNISTPITVERYICSNKCMKLPFWVWCAIKFESWQLDGCGTRTPDGQPFSEVCPHCTNNCLPCLLSVELTRIACVSLMIESGERDRTGIFCEGNYSWLAWTAGKRRRDRLKLSYGRCERLQRTPADLWL